MEAPEKIKKLVETFSNNIAVYKSTNYNETQVRREFIDPFFKTLGWDIDNEQGFAEAYKDVIHEDAVKVGGMTKAPDYSFRIGGQRKFFLEAKKPSVSIKDDIHPAYQLRRYAWSGKLPISILTDFEEFAVYDCTTKPNPNDKASTSRIMYYTYKDYIEKWDEIYSVFSKEAVLKGSFDKFAVSSKGKKGTSQVDDAFLLEMESWRDSLAKNIAIRNKDLSTRALNEAVQKTIDRIVFLRICEDRGIEDYGQLQKLLNVNNVYTSLRQIFLNADDKYNSGLFHFKTEKNRDNPDLWTLNLQIDDKILKDIIKRLYYPESPYEFSVLPADILGHVYEKFLGKVIRLTAGHQAKVEEKPEVKKAHGVYYTPTYIVDYIVKNTVGKLLEGKNTKEAEKLRILDPACGSGSFLLGAYQYFLNWYLEQYSKEPDKYTKGKQPKIYHSSAGEYRLTTSEKKNILLNNIYGVDIDSQAVEVTKLSLLLKVLEGETEETLNSTRSMFQERALPDLSNNIKCGNSLIGSDFYEGKNVSMFDEEEMYRINVFDWEKEFKEIMLSGGFDAVIGNPPWGADLIYNDYLKKKYPETRSVDDSTSYFIEKAITLSKHYTSMIVINSIIFVKRWEKAREFLIKNNLKNLINVGLTFQDANIESSIFICDKNIKSNKYGAFYFHPEKKLQINKELKFVGEFEYSILEKMNAFIASELSMKENIIISQLLKFETYFDTYIERISRGSDFENSEIKNINFDIKYIRQGPQISRYNINNIKYINHDEIKKSDKIRNLLCKKLIAKPLRGKRLAFIFDAYGDIVTGSNYANIILKKEYIDDYYYKFILGLLNSELVSIFMVSGLYSNNTETARHIDRDYLFRVPIPKINFTNKQEKAQHDRMVELVDRMLELNKKVSAEGISTQEKKVLEKQIEITDREIDKLVYELYGLTEEEIRIVEGAV